MVGGRTGSIRSGISSERARRSSRRSSGVATFPRDLSAPGLIVHVPSADYLLALKLKAIRINDPIRGEQERRDILNLMRVVGIATNEEAIAVLARYFPVSAAAGEKQRFLLKHMSADGAVDAPEYPGRKR